MGADQTDIYISADIEADGPIPGVYSMLACGLCVAGRFDGREFTLADPEAETFYTQLRPISDTFDPEAVAVTGLDRDRLITEAPEPEAAMTRLAEWLRTAAGADNPIIVGYPLIYDWMFLYWYLVRFARQDSPLTFSSGLDMKTMYQQKARVVLSRAGKDDLPAALQSVRAHTHNALDDALEQAEIFAKLFVWTGGATAGGLQGRLPPEPTS